jgi:hypothetical protein
MHSASVLVTLAATRGCRSQVLRGQHSSAYSESNQKLPQDEDEDVLELAALINRSAATQPEPQQHAGAANLTSSLKPDAASNRGSLREPSRHQQPGTSSQQRPASAGARTKQRQPTSTHSPTHATARPQTAATYKHSPPHNPGATRSTMNATKPPTSSSPTSAQRSPSQAPGTRPQTAPPSPQSRPATAPRSPNSTLNTIPGTSARGQPGQLQQGEPSAGFLGSTSGSRHQAHEAAEQYYEKYRWGPTWRATCCTP